MKKLTIILLLLCTLILISNKSKAEILTLQGTIGKYTVVMELDIDSISASGNYFYTKFKQDIPLEGTVTNNMIILNAEDTGDHFELVRSGNTFKGTYHNKKGNKLPVNLNYIVAGSIKLLFNNEVLSKSISDYSKLRLNEIKLEPTKQESVNNKYLIQWYTEPTSKIAVFKLVNGYPQLVIDAINTQLTKEFYLNFEAYYSCSGGSGNSGYDELQISNYFLNEQFVSLCISSGWYCNHAAHPDFGESGLTFNAKTGKELELEDVIWFGSGTKPKKDSDEWYTYRSSVYAPQIVKLLTSLYPKEMQKPKTEEDCDYTDPEVWDFGSWYLTEKGLCLGAYFARAARACDNPGWSVIPYSALRKLKQSNPSLKF
ncbi:hypothetical protein C3K47_17865 [Solitalea longa]|uniref:Uncharacterized protein n=1 Tax=Solitalea longa TaxID=2079460 RepID=A0A2S4ZY45_9SPHI|nr:hypothetical protein [Solitalea longa]POY34969.1 hypothetical protein C3K47_17865 [Solitalea longa]